MVLQGRINMSELSKRIKTAAEAYRKSGWNVIPLGKYEKSPASFNSVLPVYWEHNLTNDIARIRPTGSVGWSRKQGWKPLQERMATDEEFEKMFAPENITGLGVITGKTSNLYVIDE